MIHQVAHREPLTIEAPFLRERYDLSGNRETYLIMEEESSHRETLIAGFL